MTQENAQRRPVRITTYAGEPAQDIINLILNIQQNEFGVPITADDQPDLSTIPTVYQKGNGNFWLAKQDEKIVGTIGLIDAGNGIGALRKMFVQQEFRGKELSIALSLLNTLMKWAAVKGFKVIYLGTIPKLEAAIRFYEKNGWMRVGANDLPKEFPRMPVDTVFFKYNISE